MYEYKSSGTDVWFFKSELSELIFDSKSCPCCYRMSIKLHNTKVVIIVHGHGLRLCSGLVFVRSLDHEIVALQMSSDAVQRRYLRRFGAELLRGKRLLCGIVNITKKKKNSTEPCRNRATSLSLETSGNIEKYLRVHSDEMEMCDCR